MDYQRELLLLLDNPHSKKRKISNDYTPNIQEETNDGLSSVESVRDPSISSVSLPDLANCFSEIDYFSQHFENNSDCVANASGALNKVNIQSENLGNLIWLYNPLTLEKLQKKTLNLNYNACSVLIYLEETLKKKIHGQTIDCKRNEKEILNDFQKELFCILTQYLDFYYPERGLNNGEEVRYVYCLHLLNHVLKTKKKVLKNNAILSSNKKRDDSHEYRDQGFARPKVLILVPFREAALRTLKTLMQLYSANQTDNVINKQRFFEEFHKTTEHTALVRPPDYEMLFSGSIDDNFKIGIRMTRKSMMLYSEFSKSDIIMASPLGLRMVLENKKNCSFLSSIEITVLDQTDVFLMQNWEHVLYIFSRLNLQPQFSEDVDFSRVHMWCLNGWYKYYRQTIIFSAVDVPEIKSLLKYCHNYEGQLFGDTFVSEGSVAHVTVQVPQFFIKEVLTRFQDSIMRNTMIFISSYFDFVRLRNYFKKEELSFTHICEYTKDVKVARSRNLFYRGQRHFLLYTERFHFFRRYRIKGIQHLIFYSVPCYPHFYYEMCNMLQNPALSMNTAKACLLLYCSADKEKLSAIVGTKRAQALLSDDKAVHVFFTENT